MPEQLAFPGSHWYSLVAASPVPESEESANIAVIFGNGRAYHLGFLKTLPRLRGLASADEIRVYEAVLEHSAERISRGIDPMELAGIFSPQLSVRQPRTLYSEPTDEVIERIKRRFLSAPSTKKSLSEDAIVQQSTSRLDRAIRDAGQPADRVQRDVRPNGLYGDKIEQFVKGHGVPKLARAIRGVGRDLLVDSLAIEASREPGDLREVSSRIGHAFFMYHRLRDRIHGRLKIDVRTIGVLHPLPENASPMFADLQDYVGESWRAQHAVVLTGSSEEIAESLREQIRWSGEL